ncbi:MAG TPA: coenzyme F420-0:L-glutamate ligase [Mycobacteriales bacterium]|nr:coenzyme F420-0:L-glutamate ligase [Mycobacteriales bacterium]
MPVRLELFGVDGLPEVTAGDDIAGLLAAAGAELRDGDVIVVTSKIVSKAEGRLVTGTRADHLAGETARVVAERGDTQIVETHHGFVLAAAGIDASNVPDGVVALLPVDPDASAARIRSGLHERLGIDVAVIVSDTMGRPWREGVIDTAIGAAGIDVLWDLRGEGDTSGRPLEATVIAVADELASAADLVKGKLSSTPVAVIRGFPVRHAEPDRGARPLVRSAADDMFRRGTREAMRDALDNSAPLPAVDAPGVSDVVVAEDAIVPAVDAVRTDAVRIDLDGDRVTVSGTDQFTVGIVTGRLLTALATRGLRGVVAPMPEGGSVVVRRG